MKRFFISCSERYAEAYGVNSHLEIIDGENHTITRKRPQVVSRTVEFFKEAIRP